MYRRLAIALALVAVSVLAAFSLAPPATGSVIGACTVAIAGTDASTMSTGPLDDPVTVNRNSLVPVSMSAEQPMTRAKVELEFAGVRWTVHDLEVSGTKWASEVPVEDYGVYGMGLWKVIASGTGPGFECEGTALLSVEDDHELDPLATIAGLSGLGLALVGALGILGVASRIGKSRAAPFSGLLLGAVLGVGVAVLLQQFSIVYPTVGVVGALVALGAALGLAFSLFGLPGRESDARQTIHS
jgi:hypothetical protein